MEPLHYALISISLFIILIVLYLIQLNTKMSGTPEEALKISPHRWTTNEIRETYERISQKPIDLKPYLPPKLGRRYIVTGSSGLVGGSIVSQLLARGESPESIRMLDVCEGLWHLEENEAFAKCQFIKTNIASLDSTTTAFNAPWPPSVASSPLTVFHTAAVIRPMERSLLVYERCSKVNVDGTSNIITAAKEAGADILVATSSGSIAIQPVNFWVAPWTKWPKNFFQLYDESDAYGLERPHNDFFGNHAASKAAMERMVMKENGQNLKTGCIRPASGVYGNELNHNVAVYIPRDEFPTWVSHIFQNFVHAENITLAHLLFESGLISTHSSKIAGQSFVVTDPNPAITFSDIYTLIQTLKPTRMDIINLPPAVMLLVSYCIEFYCLSLVRFPWLTMLFKEFKDYTGYRGNESSLFNLQPPLFSICTHLIANDAKARKPLEEGGLGYKGIWTSLEGMCYEMKMWNDKYGKTVRKTRPRANSIEETVENLGVVPSSMIA